MNTKRFLIGVLVVWVTLFIYEGLLHAVALAGAYDMIRNILRPEGENPAMFFVLVGFAELVLALGFCFIFTKGYENKGIMEGVRFGFYTGLTFGLFFYVSQMAVYPIHAWLTFALAAGFVVELILAGVVFAAIYKPKAGS